jgi:hypothetical protein
MKAMLTVLTLTLLVSAATRSDENKSTPGPAGPKKMTVADVLKGLSLDASKLEYIDEPPGKLRELQCEASLRDTKVKVRVRIEVVYTVNLFSEKRKWDPKAIRAAGARRVTITPVSSEK